MPKSKNYATSSLVLVTLALITAVCFQGPIPQDNNYHYFSDTRAIASIGNFWNVLSNLPFLLIGIYGLLRLPNLTIQRTRSAYMALCIGIALVALGSAYYHIAPSTPSLIWDRLPMTVAFMALFSIILDEREILGVDRQTLWPLLLVGITSAAYWYWTELHGVGDLRPYILVQFLPILLMPVILVFFRAKYLNNKLLIYALFFYAFAKALEQFDRQVFHAIGILSGHTLKHFAASIAVLCIILAVPAKRCSNYSSNTL
jgi:hypothetical protein